MTSLLDALRQHSTIVADTGDLAAIARLRPRDATTNPTLILKSALRHEHAALVAGALEAAGTSAPQIALDHLLVGFGTAILALVDGRVSTEVDARLSFDTRATIERARRLIALYEANAVQRRRVLIKIAATWEGIRAAEVLEREGIGCNLTLVFCCAQAQACADAGATLISPFVGRIYDWHKRQAGHDWDEAAHAGASDPGVRSVRAIHARLKGGGYATEIMGASFRNIGQIVALAGCDLLTISPELLDQLARTAGGLERALPAAAAPVARQALSQEQFRLRLNDDAMATEKLAEGIRLFAADSAALESRLGALRAQAARSG